MCSSDLAGIAAILSIAIFGLDVVGAVGATSALVLGRLAGNAYLTRPCRAALRELRTESA